MKKERKSKLHVNKVSVSQLNRIVAGDGTTTGVGSVILCEITAECENTTTCNTNTDGPCQTYLTAVGSRERC